MSSIEKGNLLSPLFPKALSEHPNILSPQAKQPFQNLTLCFIKGYRSATCATLAANQETLTIITDTITELIDGVKQRSTLETQHANQMDLGNFVFYVILARITAAIPTNSIW